MATRIGQWADRQVGILGRKLFRSSAEVIRESNERLVNVEAKIDGVDARLREVIERMNARDAERETGIPQWTGHPDQQFGAFTYAQHGEDLIVCAIFYNLGIQRPSYLDLGAHHPLNISNTALLYARGSRGINVEANPDLIPAFLTHRPDDTTLNVGVGVTEGTMPFYRIDNFSGRNSFSKETIDAFLASAPQFQHSDTIDVPVLTISQIIERYNRGVYPDFLSIDVEGLDFSILESADFSQSRPAVICVEVVTGDGGKTSRPIIDLLRGKGFTPYFPTTGNILFVADEHIGKLAT